jgi:hypothetical protein
VIGWKSARSFVWGLEIRLKFLIAYTSKAWFPWPVVLFRRETPGDKTQHLNCNQCFFFEYPWAWGQAFSQGPERGCQILVQQYIHSKGGGSKKHSSGKPLNFKLLHVIICSKLIPNFSKHLALWVCAAMLFYLTTTFSFSQLHHQIDQNAWFPYQPK